MSPIASPLQSAVLAPKFGMLTNAQKNMLGDALRADVANRRPAASDLFEDYYTRVDEVICEDCALEKFESLGHRVKYELENGKGNVFGKLRNLLCGTGAENAPDLLNNLAEAEAAKPSTQPTLMPELLQKMTANGGDVREQARDFLAHMSQSGPVFPDEHVQQLIEKAR